MAALHNLQQGIIPHLNKMLLKKTKFSLCLNLDPLKVLSTSRLVVIRTSLFEETVSSLKTKWGNLFYDLGAQAIRTIYVHDVLKSNKIYHKSIYKTDLRYTKSHTANLLIWHWDLLYCIDFFFYVKCMAGHVFLLRTTDFILNFK